MPRSIDRPTPQLDAQNAGSSSPDAREMRRRFLAEVADLQALPIAQFEEVDPLERPQLTVPVRTSAGVASS